MKNINNENTTPLKTEEITRTIHHILRLVHSQYWVKEIADLKIRNQVFIKSKLFRLKPF